jgi:signal transduction histidine kinase
LDQAKTDFLNIASHELKTPLTAISAYLDVLDDYKEQFSKEQLQGLEAIKRNSNQLRTLIGNILELSRIESGRFELSKQDVDVEKKIVSIIDTLKVLIGEKNIELKADIGKLPVISTDELRFEEILNNLIGNAIKFTDHGIISVVATQEKDLICIKVTDTGIGIPEDKIKNLFQNFYQVDSSLGRRYGGTGLGLALTKKMIELQGGTIIAESLPGKGSTFKFTLPINLIKKDS